MKIEAIDEATIKVVLTNKEMNAYHLSYETMDSNDTATKKLLVAVLGRVKGKTDLDLENSRLFVEAYPLGEGGLILYVNFMKNTAKPIRSSGLSVPLIFSFPSLEALCGACLRLEKQTSHLILQSKLYRTQQEYQLIVWSYCRLEQRLLRIVREYGSLRGKGSIASAWIQEHGKVLLEQDAVAVMAKLG